MSLRVPSVIALIGQLQQRGLSYAMLHTFLAACKRQAPGRFVFHLGAEGKIVGCEARQETDEGCDYTSSLTNG